MASKKRMYTPSPKLAVQGSLEIKDLSEYLETEKKNFEDSLGCVYSQPPDKFEDFSVIKFLGYGSFANVYLVVNNTTNKQHAMKAISKSTVVRYKQVNHIKNEKNITLRLNFPFVTYLEYVFLDNSYIYFIMPVISEGELFNHLVNVGRFNEEQSRFLCAQVILGLEYLHYINVIYRDLKPENILIDQTGYLKIADFGFAKVIRGRTYTFCGTPEYIAPEVIFCKGYSFAVDWWSFGVFLYELNAGHPPFTSKSQKVIFENATTMKYKLPSHFTEDLKDLITNILQVDLSRRSGNLKKGVEDIKEHLWFKSTMWLPLLNRNLKPPYVPRPNKLNTAGNRKRSDGGDTEIVVSLTDDYAQYFKDF